MVGVVAPVISNSTAVDPPGQLGADSPARRVVDRATTVSPDNVVARPLPPTVLAYQDGTVHLLGVVESGRIKREGIGEANCGQPVISSALCYQWPYRPRMCRACWMPPTCRCCPR